MKTKSSWKTNLAGVVAIIASALAHFFPQYAEFWNSVITAATSLGLLAARDNTVTSEQAGVK